MADRRNVGVEVPGVGDRWDPLDHIVTESEPQDGSHGRSHVGPHDGPHAGKGPKGYVRSDARIHDEVCQALEQSSVVDASGIEVIVTDREVFLTGIVADRMQKKLAEKVVETVSGIRDVHNRLEIPRQGPPIDPMNEDIATESTVDGTTRESGTGHFGVTS